MPRPIVAGQIWTLHPTLSDDREWLEGDVVLIQTFEARYKTVSFLHLRTGETHLHTAPFFLRHATIFDTETPLHET